MTLSNIAGGLLAPLVSSNVANPGSNGLYGKNPDEKTRMATGISKLASHIAQLRGRTAILLCPRNESSLQGGYQAHRTKPQLRHFNWNGWEVSLRILKKKRKITPATQNEKESYALSTRCCWNPPFHDGRDRIADTTPPAVHEKKKNIVSCSDRFPQSNHISSNGEFI